MMNEKDKIRASVILELINSERDYVKHLNDVVEGYLYPARRHPEIFTAERINIIFSNLEKLLEFQKKFLISLEKCINWQDPAASLVGNCFLQYEQGFSIYHHYCNNHPNASSELQELYTKPRFIKFFEACRLLQKMIDISLDGFLLTPIQRICKYPLQLNELLKNTNEEHPDFGPVSNALESMRNCANLANERKRRIEALADLMSYQEKFDNWFGPKLCETSSILIYSGEVFKLTQKSHQQGVQLCLFDHLLLFSKKDLLKRNQLSLKGRINMDNVTQICDADEYKSKKSFKLYDNEQKKWFIFTTKTEAEKDEWIRAFEREKNLIESDEIEGFHITDREIGIAKRALQNRKHRSARYRHKRPDTAIEQLDLDDANTIMNRTLSLPSCIHPSHVMNFVEESRVISTSPNSHLSSRLNNNNQNASHHSNKPVLSHKSPQAAMASNSTSRLHAEYLAVEKERQASEQRRLSESWLIKAPIRPIEPPPPPPPLPPERTSSTKKDTLLSKDLTSQYCNNKRHIQEQQVDDQKEHFKDNNEDDDNDIPTASFEATLVLASGQVVRVREDSV